MSPVPSPIFLACPLADAFSSSFFRARRQDRPFPPPGLQGRQLERTTSATPLYFLCEISVDFSFASMTVGSSSRGRCSLLARNYIPGELSLDLFA